MFDIINPMQTVLVTSRHKIKNKLTGKDEEKDNAFTIDWHTPLSFEPMMYGISVGKKRFSHKLISGSKAFVVNFIPAYLEKEALYCGSHSGEHIDKFNETGLQKEEAETVDCPVLKDAIAYLECEVVDEIEIGDHVFFIAKVMKSEKRRVGKRL